MVVGHEDNENSLSSTSLNSSKLQQKSFRERVKQELFRFCQYTTIRGVSRIVNAKRKSIKILWSIFVFLLIVGLTACLILLTRTYLDYNVIHPPRVLRDEKAPFPSLTLCNLRPISIHGKTQLQQNAKKYPRSFMTNIQKYFSLMYPNRTSAPPETSQAFSFGSYIASTPRDLLPSLGQDIIQQVFQCKVNFVNESSPYTVNCGTAGKWSNLLHPMYLNCATLNFHEEYRNKIRSIELLMFLNESITETQCIDCFGFEIKSQLSGAIVVLHNADTYPDIDFEGIYIQPGTLTELKIRTYLNIQKEPPYGHCSEDTPKHLFFNNKNFSYSENACKKRVKQEEINKVCNCSAVEFPILDESLDYCLNISSFIEADSCEHFDEQSPCTQDVYKLIKNVKCKSIQFSQFSKDVVANCTLPCSFYSYESDRSTSTWPTKSHLLHWINKMERDKIVKFDYYTQVKKMKDEKVKAEALHNSSILEKNMLALMLIKPNSNVQKVEEKEVISLTSFLSQTGGLLSIWIGLSMICVVEVIELMINIWELFRGRNSNLHDESIPNQSAFSPMTRLTKSSPLDQEDVEERTSSNLFELIEKNPSDDRDCSALTLKSSTCV